MEIDKKIIQSAYTLSGAAEEGRSRLIRLKGMEDPSIKPVWAFSPPPLDEYVESDEYLGFSKLTAIQRHDAHQLLGIDPKKIFENGSFFNVAVLLWGKGSGKDWFSSIMQSYALQVLRCMVNPQEYFKLAGTEVIDTVNVSLSQDHAIETYFVKLEAAILANKWLRRHYSIYRGSRLVPVVGNAIGKPRLEILSGRVLFTDYNLRALAYGCDNEAAEGKNIIWFTLDEFSAFKDHTQMANGKKVYSTLRTSAASRFGTKWKGMIISYPRSEDDATVKLFEDSQVSHSTPEGDTIYGSNHMTWEVRPPGSFSEKTFEFDGVQVPIDFQDEFERYPEEAKAKFMCRPPAVEGAFITYPNRIFDCVLPGKRPLFGVEDTDMRLQIGDAELDETKTKLYVGKRIAWIGDRSFTAMNTPRVIHVDGGLSEDKAAMIVAHGEQMAIKVLQPDGTFQSVYMNKVIVDAAITWRPNRKKHLQVSLNSIEALILELSKQFKILRVSYDQWQGQSALETLQAHGIRAEEHTIKDKDYMELRMMIYSDAVELLAPSFDFGDMIMENKDAELLVDELRKLKILNGRVDHLPEFSKDLADALAGVNWLLNHVDEKHKVVGRMPKGVLGQAMSLSQGSPLSATASGAGDLSLVGSIPKSLLPKSQNPVFQSVNDPKVRRMETDRRFPGVFPKGVVVSRNGPTLPSRNPNQGPMPEHLR